MFLMDPVALPLMPERPTKADAERRLPPWKPSC